MAGTCRCFREANLINPELEGIQSEIVTQSESAAFERLKIEITDGPTFVSRNGIRTQEITKRIFFMADVAGVKTRGLGVMVVDRTLTVEGEIEGQIEWVFEEQNYFFVAVVEIATGSDSEPEIWVGEGVLLEAMISGDPSVPNTAVIRFHNIEEVGT